MISTSADSILCRCACSFSVTCKSRFAPPGIMLSTSASISLRELRIRRTAGHQAAELLPGEHDVKDELVIVLKSADARISLIPGIAVRPPRSTLRLASPANARIASSVPTAAIRSPRIASASAKGAAGSAVKILLDGD